MRRTWSRLPTGTRTSWRTVRRICEGAAAIRQPVLSGPVELAPGIERSDVAHPFVAAQDPDEPENGESWLETEGATTAKSSVEGVRLWIALLDRHCQQHGHNIDIAAPSEGYGPRWTFA